MITDKIYSMNPEGKARLAAQYEAEYTDAAEEIKRLSKKKSKMMATFDGLIEEQQNRMAEAAAVISMLADEPDRDILFGRDHLDIEEVIADESLPFLDDEVEDPIDIVEIKNLDVEAEMNKYELAKVAGEEARSPEWNLGGPAY